MLFAESFLQLIDTLQFSVVALKRIEGLHIDAFNLPLFQWYSTLSKYSMSYTVLSLRFGISSTKMAALWSDWLTHFDLSFTTAASILAKFNRMHVLTIIFCFFFGTISFMMESNLSWWAIYVLWASCHRCIIPFTIPE